MAERDEVLDGELAREAHAVDAGDRHALLAQGPHEIGDEGVAPPHQHHDVAGAHLPPARRQHLAARGDAATL